MKRAKEKPRACSMGRECFDALLAFIHIFSSHTFSVHIIIKIMLLLLLNTDCVCVCVWESIVWIAQTKKKKKEKQKKLFCSLNVTLRCNTKETFNFVPLQKINMHNKKNLFGINRMHTANDSSLIHTQTYILLERNRIIFGNYKEKRKTENIHTRNNNERKKEWAKPSKWVRASEQDSG